MTLTNILLNTPLNGEHKHIKDQTIEVDQASYSLNYAVTFEGCKFALPQNSTNQSFTIFTDQGIRFESCELKVSVCIWGNDGRAGFSVLDHKGPNVFFDSCRWLTFKTSFLGQVETTLTPQIQISGFVNHCISNPTPDSKVNLLITQIRFNKIEVTGQYTQFQMVEYTGNEFYLKDFTSDFLWIREKMLPNIRYIEVDDPSTKSVSSLFIGQSHLTPHDLDVIKNFLEVFSDKKEGHKFLQFNEAYCTRVPAPDFSAYLSYSVFKNFYAITPWIKIALCTIFVFSFFYYPFEIDFPKAILASIYAISGNPTIDTAEISIYSLLKAIEAFLGIFFVIIISWVLGRKYSNYI